MVPSTGWRFHRPRSFESVREWTDRAFERYCSRIACVVRQAQLTFEDPAINRGHNHLNKSSFTRQKC